MPKIGLRIIKSAVAVFLCFVVYELRGEVGIPFYSAIAAILCMQPYVGSSKKVALNRVIATFLGGLSGMLVLLLVQNTVFSGLTLLRYFVISACIVPLIYITVLCKKPSASYITCVVFLSVTVSHGMDVNPYAFAVSRILDTLIGIGVSLGVNAFHLPHHKNRDLLFVCDLDGTLLHSDGALGSYEKVRLQSLLREGAKITLATARTPATIVPLLEGVEMRLPVIAMNGAILYDLRERKYLGLTVIPPAHAQAVWTLFDGEGVNCFAHTVVNDHLQIYYTALRNPAEEAFYQRRRTLPLKSYLCAPLPPGQEVLSFTVIDTREAVERLHAALESLPCGDSLSIVHYPGSEYEGYYFLEISSAAASKARALAKLKEQLGCRAAVAFGDSLNDIPMLLCADHGFAVENAQPEVKAAAGHQIGPNDSDAVVKTIARLFHSHSFLSRG
ncbi:MAG: hydrolase [Clostridiales bacterium]|uniref:HAD-IIB family hydrolase n=1 Tax=Provencibacterium massiliense TaxID=1841868 RepID=UPI000D79D4AE|nr:HAD-IIB family hydrolase [Provencibacterium massiliense]PWM38925.1 MAG: hydrolase [Clostridiales bacterium]RGB68866.1 HAD-IIB family hydrolase [Harryflintia acetispora]